MYVDNNESHYVREHNIIVATHVIDEPVEVVHMVGSLDLSEHVLKSLLNIHGYECHDVLRM